MTPEQLRASILQQAMEGKLVKQDPNDEPASVLLEKIAEEKARLIREKKIKRTKKLPEITDDEKPFEIPDSWEWVRMSDVLDVRDGTHDSPKYIDNGIPLITSKNISNGYLDFSNVKYISQEDADKINERSSVDDNDIIFAMIGTIGNPIIIKKDREFAIKNVALLKHFSERVYMPFILQYMWVLQAQFNENASGAVQKFVSLKKIRQSLIPIPPLVEQKRIVAKIDQIMPLVDEYAEAYDKLKKLDDGFNDKLKQSLLQYAMEGKLVKQDPNDEPASELLKKIKDEKKQLVKEKKIKRSKSLPRISEDEKLFDIPENWEWVRLKDITNFGNFNSVAGQDIQEGSWVLNMEDIIKNGGGFNKFTIKKLNDDFKSNKYIVEVGDVLYGKLRPYLRKIEIAPKNGFTTTEMFPIKVINQNLISPYYLRYVMLSPYFANRINGSTYGMKMPRVGTKYLASMLIPLPPFEEQKRIVTKVEKMMALVK